MRVCSVPGCPTIYPKAEGTRCHTHRGIADRNRGTTHQRGYSTKEHKQFRQQVLHHHPVCVLCRKQPSTVADHFPHSRKELINAGKNPNNPQHGRGLCAKCHNKETAKHQPGGWNNRH